MGFLDILETFHNGPEKIQKDTDIGENSAKNRMKLKG